MRIQYRVQISTYNQIYLQFWYNRTRLTSRRSRFPRHRRNKRQLNDRRGTASCEDYDRRNLIYNHTMNKRHLIQVLVPTYRIPARHRRLGSC